MKDLGLVITGVTSIFACLAFMAWGLARIVGRAKLTRGLTSDMASAIRNPQGRPLNQLTKRDLKSLLDSENHVNRDIINGVLQESKLAFWLTLIMGLVIALLITIIAALLIIYYYGDPRSVVVTLRPKTSDLPIGHCSVSYTNPSNSRLSTASGEDGRVVIEGVPWNASSLTFKKIQIAPLLVTKDRRNPAVIQEKRPYIVTDENGAPNPGPPWTFDIINDKISIPVLDTELKPAPRPNRQKVLFDLKDVGFEKSDVGVTKPSRHPRDTVLTVTNAAGMPLDVYAFDLSQAFEPKDLSKGLAEGKPPGMNLLHFHKPDNTSKSFAEFNRYFPDSAGWFAIYLIYVPRVEEEIVFSDVVNLYNTSPSSQPEIIVSSANATDRDAPIAASYRNCTMFGDTK